MTSSDLQNIKRNRLPDYFLDFINGIDNGRIYHMRNGIMNRIVILDKNSNLVGKIFSRTTFTKYHNIHLTSDKLDIEEYQFTNLEIDMLNNYLDRLLDDGIRVFSLTSKVKTVLVYDFPYFTKITKSELIKILNN